MAEAFIAAVSYIGAALGGVGGATLAIYAVEIGTALYFAAAIAVSVSYSAAQRRKAARNAKDAYNASLEDRLVMAPLANAQRSRVYGQVRNVEGVLFKATRGVNSEIYTLVVSVAGHRVEAIDTVYFDDVAVTLDADGYVQSEPYSLPRIDSESVNADGNTGTVTLPVAPLNGAVTGSITVLGASDNDNQVSELAVSISGTVVTWTAQPNTTVTINYQRSANSPKARVRKYLGGPTQNLAPVLQPLFPDLLTADDRFAGDACLVVDLEYDTDAFPSGLPNITAVVRGAMDVFDPRTGTYGYTRNPALIARDWCYYAFGGNFAAGTVRDADVIAAANACDVVTRYSTAAGFVDVPLYTCGIVCRTDQDPSHGLDEIVESMAGRSGWSGGVMRLRAGVYRAPVPITITEDWLSGAEAITVVAEGPAEEAINIVKATIADEAQSYTVAPAPTVRAEAYITNDGRELPQDLTYGGIGSAVQAQHVSGIILREARSGLTVTLPCNLRAFALELFDVVPVTLPQFGWVGKLFEVAEWRFSAQGGVGLTLRETGASIFDVAALFERDDATPNTALPNPFYVPPITGVAVASGTAHLLRQKDGSVVSQMHVSWSPLLDQSVISGGSIEVRYALASLTTAATYADSYADNYAATTSVAESRWTSFDVPGGDGSVDIPGVLDGGVYLVKVRARNALVRGQWSAQVQHRVIGKTAPPRNVSAFAYTVVASGVQFTWANNPEADRGSTVVRLGSTWAGATPIVDSGADADIGLWLSPPVGTFSVLAKHYDTSGNESADATSLSVTITAANAVAWANILGRPQLFRVSAYGASDTGHTLAGGLYNGETLGLLHGASRSYMLARIRRTDGVVTFAQFYDVFSSGTDAASPDGFGRGAAQLAADLNATTNASIVVVYSFDEPATLRLTAGLDAAMYRCGASRGVFGSPQFQARGAYVLIGFGGCGEGNGFESYSGSVPNDPNAWCDVAFQLLSGNLLITGSGATPRTLADYSYTGSLDATTDLVLIGRGVGISGNVATKVSATAAWDSDAYSRDSFTGGAYVSAVPAQSNASLLFGLNSDPLTDSNYTSLDYALSLQSDGQLVAFESNAAQGALGAYAAGDVLAITYDGARITYLKNGVVLGTPRAAPSGLVLFFDSSFNTPGARLTNIRFGPMSAVSGIGTGQLASEAATAIYELFDAAGIGFTNAV